MSPERKTCYVASYLGFAEAGCHYYHDVLLPTLSELVETIDPFSLAAKEDFVLAAEEGRGQEFSMEVGRRNIEAIRNSDLVVALLDGADVDSGVASEIGFAMAQGIPIFGLRSDLRMSGEPGVHVNLQVEAFIDASGGAIATNLDDLILLLSAYLAGSSED